MSNSPSTPAPAGRGLTIALWSVQALLAFAFGAAGAMKTFTPIAELALKLDWTAEAPLLTRFIGVSELAGAVGLVLPAATRIQPRLTPIAAACLAFVMVLAAIFHVARGEAGHLAPNVVLLGLALFVAWGRWSKAPIAPR